MEGETLNEYLVYAVSEQEKVPVAILRGKYQQANEPFNRAMAKSLEIRQIIPAINELKETDQSSKKQFLKDIREVMEDPNQTEIIVSPNCPMLPFCGENGFTFYLMSNSILQARGSLRRTEGGITETKNGIHTVYVDGNARLFILLKTVDVYVINGVVAVDIDCKYVPDFNKVTQCLRQQIKPSISIESIVSVRSLHQRAMNSFKKRTSQFIIYQSTNAFCETNSTDMANLVPLGYCLGNLCRQEIVRDQLMYPMSNKNRSNSIRFVMANLLDPRIKKDINYLEGSTRSCSILGSNRASIILFGCTGSGIMLAGYWYVIVLTNQVQVIKSSDGRVDTHALSNWEQIVIKLNQGSIQCLVGADNSHVIVDSLADFSIEKHQSIGETANITTLDVNKTE